MILLNLWVKEETIREIRKYFKLNDNLLDIVRVVFRGKFKALNANIRKEERAKINHAILQSTKNKSKVKENRRKVVSLVNSTRQLRPKNTTNVIQTHTENIGGGKTFDLFYESKITWLPKPDKRK